MCSYNAVNGVPACASSDLLQKVCAAPCTRFQLLDANWRYLLPLLLPLQVLRIHLYALHA